jgi:protein-L-isoaspartate(D-aspartate) O-methyltransferase
MPHSELLTEIKKHYPIEDQRLIKTFLSIDRSLFLPPELVEQANEQKCIVVGDYSMSEPGLVCFMVQECQVKEGDTILDIGSGTGYHAALLAGIGSKVYGVEVLEAAYTNATASIQKAGISNIELKCANGWDGWIEKGPFDVINIACGVKRIPYELIDQLKVGGRMIFPLAPEGKSPYTEAYQSLVLLKKIKESSTLDGLKVYPRLEIKDLMCVRFMEMVN